MLHASGLKITNFESNKPDLNPVCKLQKKSLTKVRSEIRLMYAYLPRLIL